MGLGIHELVEVECMLPAEEEMKLGATCAGIGDLGVLTTHETSPCFFLGNAHSIRTG